jgi:putative toxin-antitoxin system antitoxin component (TIGR02293 family)
MAKSGRTSEKQNKPAGRKNLNAPPEKKKQTATINKPHPSPASNSKSKTRYAKNLASGNKAEPKMVVKETLTHYHAKPILVHSSKKPESQLTDIEKMEFTIGGISKKELEQLKKKAGLDYDQLAHMLDVARSTLINKKLQERFSPGLGEKIMSLADIYSYGYEVFGDQEQFNQWIFQPIAALGDKAPYDIMNNLYGRQEVRNLVGRIAYGVYS